MPQKRQPDNGGNCTLEDLAGFDELSNIFGRLPSDIRKHLVAVLREPTEATWNRAYCIILRGRDHLTLWKAWIATDPTAPRTGPVMDANGKRLKGWSRIPTSEQVFEAIRYAAS